MKSIKTYFWGTLICMTALWLLADTFLPQPLTYFSFRNVFVQYSGLVATAVMSISMYLAMRPKWLEPHLDGLDKMYRLHKWLGITALVMSILHWWWAKGTKWLVGWGLLEKPQRPPRGDVEVSWIQNFINSQRGFSEGVGEWAFYLMLILLVLALARFFPYRLFRKTHKWLALIYLLIVYHSVILTKFEYWAQPIGWVSGFLMVAGTWSAIMVLAGRVGKNLKASGQVTRQQYFPDLETLQIAIKTDHNWKGHKAGQFAFVTLHQNEGPHPFTIASHWDDKTHEISIISKSLGDYTRNLHANIEVGQKVTLEGPYGCFNFADDKPRQIWIGAGIGITPFIARLKHLAIMKDQRPIDLFHPTMVHDPVLISQLEDAAREAGVKLHVMVDEVDGYLDAERINKQVPEWQSASVWFCGPPKFGYSLRAALTGMGLKKEAFHQELFHFR